MSFMIESEMSEMRACVCVPLHGRRTRGFSMGQKYFKQKKVLRRLQRRDKNACQCAVHESVEKHACSMVSLYHTLHIVKYSFNITLSVSRSRVATFLYIFFE